MNGLVPSKVLLPPVFLVTMPWVILLLASKVRLMVETTFTIEVEPSKVTDDIALLGNPGKSVLPKL